MEPPVGGVVRVGYGVVVGVGATSGDRVKVEADGALVCCGVVVAVMVATEMAAP